MPVTARPLLAAVLLCAACDTFDGAPLPVGSAAPSASAAAPTEETHQVARAAADAALACARTCILHWPPFDDAADECPVDAASVDALDVAAGALAAHVKPRGLGGPVGAFTTTVGMFAAWMKQGIALKRTRGTLRLFQDVADAWNAYQPGEPLPVDPVQEMRRAGFGSKGYIVVPVKKSGERLVWKSCYDGPCLWENHW
jgi:hypothetical protein